MGKWLALVGIAIIAALVLLWRQLGDASAIAAPAAPAPPPVGGPGPGVAAARPTAAAPAAAPATAASSPPAKLDVESDAFFYRFQEVVPAVLSRNAATCYEGIARRVHRNQKLVLAFTVKIKGGVVTVGDVKADVNTLDNPGLTACFIQEVQRTTWTDPELPDWEAEDELVIRPERGLKKYLRESVDYVGAPAPAT